MERFMDLHTHTIYSDGDKTPQQIVKEGKEIGLTDIAITDHDIIDGLKMCLEYFKNKDTQVVPIGDLIYYDDFYIDNQGVQIKR